MTEVKDQRGFTLIEIVLVLAISSALTIILLNGFTLNRRRVQFNDSVERIVTLLERTKTEANSSFTTGGGGPDSTRIFFAKVLYFNGTRAFYDTLTATNAESLRDVSTPLLNRSLNLAWGVSYTSGNANTIVFSRDPGGDLLKIYVFNSPVFNCTDNCSSIYSAAASTTTANMIFTSPDGLRATVSVNPNTGEIKRTF